MVPVINVWLKTSVNEVTNMNNAKIVFMAIVFVIRFFIKQKSGI